MREISFRAKRVDNGKWVYGYYIKATHHWHNHGIHEDWIATDTVQNGGWCNVRGKYAVIPDTIGQFTGKTVKNGKVFEGDIGKSIDGLFLVRWSEEKSAFVMNFYDYPYEELYLEEMWEDSEIIGNINDNIELLNRTPQNDEVSNNE